MPRRIPESQRIRISHKREEVDAATTADAVLVADEGVPTKSSSNQPLNPLKTSGSPLDAPADPKVIGVIAFGAASPSSIEMQIPPVEDRSLRPHRGPQGDHRLPHARGSPIHRHHGRMNLEIHRPDIGGNVDQISPLFTAAPQKDAAVSSSLHAPASPPGTAEPAGNRLSSSDAAGSRKIRFAQARKQRNLLDSP